MEPLFSAALFWLILHFAAAGALRRMLVGVMGEKFFRAAFALASIFGLVWLVREFNAAPQIELWQTFPGARALAAVVMAPAFLLLALAAGPKNPTSVPAAIKAPGKFPLHGVFRITRHPMLWAFSLWAAAHLLVNADAAALLFFGVILLTSLNGMVSIDAKREHAFPESWRSFAAQTSILPFGAILAGRTPLVLAELSWLRLGLGAGLYLLFFLGHGVLIGVAVY
jgi:uncharacterized membrane protein